MCNDVEEKSNLLEEPQSPQWPDYKFYTDKLFNINHNKLDNKKIKELAVLILNKATLDKLLADDIQDPKLQYLFEELSKPGVLNQVLDKLEKSSSKALSEEINNKSKNKELIQDLEDFVSLIRAFKQEINVLQQGVSDVSFEGLGDDVKETLPHLPWSKIGRILRKVHKGDYDNIDKDIRKLQVATIDNTAFAHTKSALALATAGKGAAIGAVFGPVGSAIGAAIGGLGTLMLWGKVRDKIVDKVMED